ncbi:NAD+ synthase [Endozoicomonas euniceicola]|uniref:Glutamine-dependent NAD(+) synthetase n=1 Tax=Endozoicomonas euniceicola TaxID=1234143 RepID=A0ABY6GRD8_9GAMM|nr:NAD+ synthase [Endozoicomonas euniceicola]UYM15323.1 NAD+ synthase [Endozoicomonas euniceicola]
MSAAMLNIVMAQINLKVGDIDGNTSMVINAAEQARDTHQADLVVFPELTLCGYPPEDLLLRPSLILRTEQALHRLNAVKGIDIVIGVPGMGAHGLENQAVVLRDGQVMVRYAKQHLPNYQVFDEKRYFVPGHQIATFDCKGTRLALTICEDLWFQEPAMQAREAGADLILSLNASPFHKDKQSVRRETIRQRCQETGLPVLYVNLFGGQDELVFDGGSFAMNGDGRLMACGDYFSETLTPVRFDCDAKQFVEEQFAEKQIVPLPDLHSRVYRALVTGVRDYVNKNGFKGVVLGLSGGIDSALTLAIAVDALGADRVQAVMMPYRYTSEMSLQDAKEEADILGVDYKIMPIEPMFDAFMNTLSSEFADSGRDTTEENLQSRCRGVLLMAISNKKGYMVLTTGNKSEMAVGYATLYGDMCGGYNALKDVPKTLVFELSEYRNSLGYVIPQRVIDRPPSAELAPDQVDEDSLPPYSELDRIIEMYVEEDCSAETIIDEGFDRDTVYRVLRLIDINEFKRRQAVVGVRITPRGFGRDRRYPITNGWRPGV